MKRSKMKVIQLLLLVFFIHSSLIAQVPSYYKQNKHFNESLQNIVHEVGLDSTWDVGEDGKEQISFAVIDLTGKKPVFGGINFSNFIYPASVYKMYVAMEILFSGNTLLSHLTMLTGQKKLDLIHGHY
jgi:hypothetical protein